MEDDVKEKLDDLEKRMKYQEDIHKNIDATPSGFVHGVVSNLPILIASIGLSAMIAVLIVNNKKK